MLDPDQSVRTLFSALPVAYEEVSLVEALGLNGGGISALLRHAVAAVLNALHPAVAYPLTVGEIIALVNGAILSGDPATIEALKDRLMRYNELGSDLDANGRWTTSTTVTTTMAPARGHLGPRPV